MASKCWFVLQQTHYPPPQFDPQGFGAINGPICPGHLIPDLRRIDNVINRETPLEIPCSMPLYRTQGWDLKWNLGQERGAGLSSKFTAPIGTAGSGLAIATEAGLAFQRSVQNYWAFESLESFIIQPTRSYIDDAMDSDDVATYLQRKGLFRSSSLFMITGVIVARGAKNITTTATRQKTMTGSLGVEVPTVLSATLRPDITHSEHSELSANKFTDFVWAVQLAKISRGLLDRQWSHETVASGATFSTDARKTTAQDIVTTLRENELDIPLTNEFRMDGDVFIIGVGGADTTACADIST